MHTGKNKKATSITIRSHANHTFKIKIPPYAQTITLNKKTSNKQEEYISLPMKKGDIVVYRYKFRRIKNSKNSTQTSPREVKRQKGNCSN